MNKVFKLMSGRILLISILLVFLFGRSGYAGPPFNTDDPQPVDFRHWEYYISSINTVQDRSWAGTCPHFEVNYGLINDVQVHLLLPLNYEYSPGAGSRFGYAYSEAGLKYRFIQESENRPQVGVFPIVEIPTVRNGEFGNGKAQVYLPVWAQKSWGKLTTYGGVGYWINPGTGNRNWIFTGWEVQYDFTRVFTLGGELYFHTANTTDSKASAGFNLGGFVNLTDKFHVLFSVGHSITNESYTSSYFGLLMTI